MASWALMSLGTATSVAAVGEVESFGYSLKEIGSEEEADACRAGDGFGWDAV